MFRARKVPFLMPGQRPNRSPELWIISEPFGDDQITRARYGDESEKESSSLSCGFFVCSPFTRHGIVPQPTTKCHNFWELLGTDDAALERRRRNGLVHACTTADGVAKFTAMRIVSILSGLAVLFTTLAFGHLMHHYFVNAGEAAHSPPFLAGMAIGIVVGIFSLIGACLLLRRGR